MLFYTKLNNIIIKNLFKKYFSQKMIIVMFKKHAIKCLPIKLYKYYFKGFFFNKTWFKLRINNINFANISYLKTIIFKYIVLQSLTNKNSQIFMNHHCLRFNLVPLKLYHKRALESNKIISYVQIMSYYVLLNSVLGHPY